MRRAGSVDAGVAGVADGADGADGETGPERPADWADLRTGWTCGLADPRGGG